MRPWKVAWMLSLHLESGRMQEHELLDELALPSASAPDWWKNIIRAELARREALEA